MVFVGTSGYSYEDWIGTFYPESTKRTRMLELYCEEFEATELNFTYYRIPSVRTMQSLASRTPRGFRFIVKANEATTHKRDLSLTEEFKEGIKPLLDEGKLYGILLQFPYAFKNTEQNRRYLHELRGHFEDYELIVEFRHNSWINPAVFDFLRRNRLAFCCVDEPRISRLVPPVAVVTSEIAYVRFHSRDASKWFADQSKERYNYRYSKEELSEWLPKVKKLAEQASDIYIFFNNCHAGHAAVNAIEFKNMLFDLGIIG